MIEINIPNTFVQERKYVLDIIAKYIGFGYKLNLIGNIENIELILNAKKVIIQDDFFSKFNDDISYLDEKNIPDKVSFVKNEFTFEDNIPLIFGNQSIDITEDSIFCEIDIISSIFFMLTRWEEYVIKTRDTHNRFPASSSLAYRNGFLHRPVVDEYICLFYQLLCKIGYNGNLNHRKFKITMTHDIDYFYKWSDFAKFLKTLAGDILVRKNLKVLFSNISLYLKIKQNKALDPNITFDYFMNLADKIGVKSHFFFMSGGLTKKDNHYKIENKSVKSIIKNIQDRGHIVGIHPSYNTYSDKKQLLAEKKNLEEIAESTIYCGRQHYLRFEIPTTWQLWNDIGFQWDSSMYYSEAMGFRTGACFDFPVFNFISREELKLKEQPLIVMDTTVLNDKNTAWNIHKDNIINLYNTVKKYNGNFVVLWHNSNVNTHESRNLRDLFESILKG